MRGDLDGIGVGMTGQPGGLGGGRSEGCLEASSELPWRALASGSMARLRRDLVDRNILGVLKMKTRHHALSQSSWKSK